MYVLAIIQARVGSTRLPGKVLAEINNRPLLWYVVRRAQLATLVDAVVVATPDTPDDLEIAQHCAKWDVPHVVGDEQDVLGRFLAVATSWPQTPDLIVRITADCPLIDPQLIDGVVRMFLRPVGLISGAMRLAPVIDPSIVYASNVFPERTFPDGLDVEAFPLSTLVQLDEFAELPRDREHVTSFLHTHPKVFLGGGRGVRTARMSPNIADARWTVDTLEDLEFVRAVYGVCRWDASMQDIIEGCRRRVMLPGERHS